MVKVMFMYEYDIRKVIIDKGITLVYGILLLIQFNEICNLPLYFAVFCTAIFPKKQNHGLRTNAKKILRTGRTGHAPFLNNNKRKPTSLYKQQ